MKKIFSLVALFATVATATWANVFGPFTVEWSKYDEQAVIWDESTPNTLTLNNATNLTRLEVTCKSVDDKDATYIINVSGTNKVSTTGVYNGLEINTAGMQYSDKSGYAVAIVKIIGEGAGASLELIGQKEAGIYVKSKGSAILNLQNVDVTATGKLNTAAYGITADDYVTITMQKNVRLTMEGKNSAWNRYHIWKFNGNPTLVEPADGTFNNVNENCYVAVDGSNYNGKVVLATGSGITIDGVEIDVTNQDNFTHGVESGKVSYEGGVLTLDNAIINGDLATASAVEIKVIGKNRIEGDLKASYTTLISSEDAGELRVNGEIMSSSYVFDLTISGAHVSNYTNYYTLYESISGGSSKLTLTEHGSYYGEAQGFSATLDYGSTYTKTEGTTAEGLKTLHIREIEDYGLLVAKSDYDRFEVTNENASDILDDGGSVVYDPENKRLTLTNANLNSILCSGLDWLEINLEGVNMIAQTSGMNALQLETNQLKISGTGSANIVSRITAPGIVGADVLLIENTTLNFSTAGYAIDADKSTVYIQNSNVTFMSTGAEGVINVANFELEDAEFVTPADVSFFSSQLCVNYQPVAVNTKVEIKATATGLEEVLSADTNTQEAHKVMIDGQIYILRDGKAYNVLGAEVK